MKKIFLAAIIAISSTSAFAIGPFDMPWVNHPARDTVYKTSDHPNGVFVLEFFANFCGACNDNAGNVDALAEAYANEPRVQVLDVGIDANDREIAQWIARHRPNHPVLKDVGRAVWREVGSQYIPTVVITDCHGVEQYRYTGVWNTSTKATIQSKINAALATTCE